MDAKTKGQGKIKGIMNEGRKLIIYTLILL